MVSPSSIEYRSADNFTLKFQQVSGWWLLVLLRWSELIFIAINLVFFCRQHPAQTPMIVWSHFLRSLIQRFSTNFIDKVGWIKIKIFNFFIHHSAKMINRGFVNFPAPSQPVLLICHWIRTTHIPHSSRLFHVMTYDHMTKCWITQIWLLFPIITYIIPPINWLVYNSRIFTASL